jgi:flagellar hook-associated protein 1 FlgK
VSLSYSIALSGLNAAQTGIDTVSQNISNAGTPGYVREQVNQSALIDTSTGAGAGVIVNSISQVSSGFQNQVLANATAQNSYANALSQVVTSAQSFLNEPSSNGISEQLANFWSAFDTVANTPNQLAPRQQLVADAQQLSTTFNQLSSSFNQLYTSTVNSISSDVTTVNTQLQQIAQLNQQIQQAGPSSSNTLIDQQNQILNSLQGTLGVTTQSQSDGTINVLLGGITLVQGNISTSLSVQAPSAPPMPSANQVSLIAASSGTAAPVNSGSIGGLLTAVNQTLPNYSTQFDSVASSFATTVNTQLTAGNSYPGNGTTPQAGTPMFVFGGNGSATALNLSVSSAMIADPFTIAAAGNPPGGNNDGSNAQKAGELGSLSNGPDALWRSTVGSFGLDVANAQNLVSSTNASYQSAYQAQQATSGVSTNQELVNLLNYQQGYQAAAKVISTISSTVQTLLQAV